jgi:hypothetical protein
VRIVQRTGNGSFKLRLVVGNSVNSRTETHPLTRSADIKLNARVLLRRHPAAISIFQDLFFIQTALAATAIPTPLTIVADRSVQQLIGWKHSIYAKSQDNRQFDCTALFYHLLG